MGLVACAYIYFLLYVYYITCAWSALRAQPYCKYKCACYSATSLFPCPKFPFVNNAAWNYHLKR